MLVSKTRQEERPLPPQVAIFFSPAVMKVTWEDRSPGREGGEQPLVAGKYSVDESLLPLSPIPPVIRSRLVSLEEPEDCQLSTHLNSNHASNGCLLLKKWL